MLLGLLVFTGSFGLAESLGAPGQTGHGRTVTLSFRDTPIAEACEMLAKKERVNIILGKDVEGRISASLYEVSLEEAILYIAESAGYVVESRRNGYVIIPAAKAKESNEGMVDTEIRTFKVQYSKPDLVEKILTKHLSTFGKITVLEDRKVLVIEDLPIYMERIESLLKAIDKPPQQIRIEAKILEVTLDDTETFGLDWTKLFSASGGSGEIKLQGFAVPEATGFVAQLINSKNLNFVLNALSARGRVHTLSSPKLLALENQEASVIIGDRQGYRVTTTINQVTSESIEYLESGVILNVTPTVDEQGRILMRIHPEVSSGSITLGIPSQTTTEVNTYLLAEGGQPIFIGGLIKNNISYVRAGIPYLGSIPWLGHLFSSSEEITVNTETVVIITPYIVDLDKDRVSPAEDRRIDRTLSQLLHTEALKATGLTVEDLAPAQKKELPQDSTEPMKKRVSDDWEMRWKWWNEKY